MRWPQLRETVADLDQPAERERLRRRRYGRIEACEGRWQAIELRPWPKWISRWEVAWQARRVHAARPGDRVLLYYKQPWNHPRFLTVQYAVSHRDTGLPTLRAALEVLDYVACLKRSDALVCEITTDRLSDRVLRRAGWESHCPGRHGRHYIKRFYGDYPDCFGSGTGSGRTQSCSELV